MPPASPLPAGDPHRVITGPDGVVEVIVSLSEYQQLQKAREELRRLRQELTRSAIAAQMREGVAQFEADPDAFRTLTPDDLLRTDVFDRP
ncbi:hypothetical protein IFM12275_59960 [Nocardia sputorum]|uniref:hypothetical protein n=1 Tax=Nocardia sputorum TaxID=2984338 RepID=UPI002491AE0C|nr:hypothetical protein [Nocardia sputorum]BDT96020.1 hypothetical protein IFM12275_59960 [Nocardia sputorum]